MSAHLVLAVLAILAARVGFLYLRPFGPAPSARAPATSSAGRGAARSAPGARDSGASSAPARTVRKLARKIRHGRQAAARYQQEDNNGTP